MANIMNYHLQVYSDDVLYSPLPMYHSSAGAMITGNAMLEGVTIVSRYYKTQSW